VPRPPLNARRQQALPAGSPAVGGPGAAHLQGARQVRYLLMFVGGADDLAGSDAAFDCQTAESS
jgi:hypothetical protein